MEKIALLKSESLIEKSGKSNDHMLADQGFEWIAPRGIKKDNLKKTVCGFLDVASTSFGRATHYNTREEQQKAELAVHKKMMNLDRDLYALFLMLPGVLDRSVQIGINNLLGTPRDVGSSKNKLLNSELERKILYFYLRKMPAHMVLKMFIAFRYGDSETVGIPRANNARTRKLVLRTILNSEKLEWWSVKYRKKLRSSLTHVWGRRKASILRSILSKGSNDWTAKEYGILHSDIDGYHQKRPDVVYECVCFVLGGKKVWKLPLLKAYKAAKKDLKKGSRLPKEVLEGIRSTFHKDVSKDEVLSMAASEGTITKKERLLVQRQAKKAGVEVKMNPLDYDAIRLYIYGFEMGFTTKIKKALAKQAIDAASGFPYRYDDLGILVDASLSMSGDKTQAMRPIATALALRDMLASTSNNCCEVFSGGKRIECPSVKFPEGDTDLASGLLRLIESCPDEIFVISDGYENRPAGRFADVVSHLRKVGIKTPIHHINPVFAGESGGVRELAPGLVTTMPVKDPKSIGLSIIRGVLEEDPKEGINLLISRVVPRLKLNEERK